MQPSVLPPPPSGGDGGDKGRKMCSNGHANPNHQHQAPTQGRPQAQSSHNHPPRPPGGKGVMNGGPPSPHPSQGGCEASAGPHTSRVGNGHCSACLVTGSGRQSNGQAETVKGAGRPALTDVPANKDGGGTACRGGIGGEGGGTQGGGTGPELHEQLEPSCIFQQPIVVDKAHVIRLASQYTPCAGCSAAVKALLKRPIHELRLLNAVMTGDESNNTLRLRDQYMHNPQRTAQLLETFPLSGVMKKVQPTGDKLRCQVHRRANHSTSQHGNGSSVHDNWDWEDAWERLPAELREKVATIEIANLDTAMHHATATHRFCADCKHNVVTALDLLTGKYGVDEVENGEEYNQELFRPFADKIVCKDKHKPDGPKILQCQVAEVEDLITWHEDFDSQEYTSSGQQRHAATLEHGQREVRSIIGSLLLSQLKACWHNHTAQVQAEQYLFFLVVHAIRTQLASSGFRMGASDGRPSDSSYPMITHLSSSSASSLPLDNHVSPAELALRLLEEEEEEATLGSKKSKSKKKKERRAKAKARRSMVDSSESSAASAVMRAAGGSTIPEDDDEYEDAEEEGPQPCRNPHHHPHHPHGAVASTSTSTSTSTGPRATPATTPTGATGGGGKQKRQPKQQAAHECAGGSAATAATGAQRGHKGAQHGKAGKGEDRGKPKPFDGMSLLDQLDDDYQEDDSEAIDPALLREMEQLKSSLEAKSDLQSHREHLRSKLATNFQKYCISNHA